MEQAGRGLSIRYKLLLLLTSLPLVSLGLYLFMATSLFEKDKIAYVYDSSVAVSHSLAVQTRMEIDGVLAKIRPMMQGMDLNLRKIASSTQEFFDKQNEIQSLSILRPTANGAFEMVLQLYHQGQSPQVMDAKMVRVAREAFARGLSLRPSVNPMEFIFAQKIANGADTVLQMTVFRSRDLSSAFSQSGLYASFLIAAGQIILGPTDIPALQNKDPQDVFGIALRSQTPEGTGEVALENNTKMLMSYAKVSLGDLLVTSVVDKKEALRAVDVLVRKSLLFFIALIASTVAISLIASVQLTSALRQLVEATQKVAHGDFNVAVKTRSDDEIGGLAKSFNLMAKEVARLMIETAEKARMATELATVKTVQETLFPESRKQFGAFEVVGYFEPASECGGDWWSYSLSGDKLFCWIGDATGHGASAALITSAARSAASIIEMLPNMTPAKALQIMNRAIGETSKGKIMMTFFIAMVDLKTGVLTYSNASHDPPYIVRKPQDRKMTKKDLTPLMDGTGPRLGDQPHAQYRDVVVQMEPGDMLFFYTDGIIDLKNPQGDTWGERTFLKNVIASVDTEGSANSRMESLKGKISEYRQDAQLIDDVTILMCQYRSQAA